jgi:acetylornithine deacetylase/succinyl-diaminopimelate desuccinylase-like protein
LAVGVKEVYEFVDRNSESFLGEFREFIRRPGISSENSGIEQTVNWLVAKMKECGVDSVELYRTKRHPLVLGWAGEGTARTLLVYGHYDVQPPGDSRDWRANPFGGEIVGHRILGRGTCDMKNNLMACLHAVKAFVQQGKPLPVNLMFLFEGEEEIGSPNLKPFLDKHKQLLSTCDAILCGDGGGENKKGQNLLIYGLKGLLYVELTVKAATGADVHSSFAGVVDNPAWRLISALKCLKERGEVLIPHFYEGVSDAGLGQKESCLSPEGVTTREEFEEAFELKLKRGMNAQEALFEFYYKPTLNIDGLRSGYTVEKGMKTIVPKDASTKIDMRLLPGQESSTILRNMKKHLLDKGFVDVKVQKLGFDTPAYRVGPHERITCVVTDAIKKVLSNKTMTMPIAPFSGAMAWLPRILGKPMAFAGSGPFYMAHRPNEFITKEQYLKGVKLFATIYNDYAL